MAERDTRGTTFLSKRLEQVHTAIISTVDHAVYPLDDSQRWMQLAKQAPRLGHAADNRGGCCQYVSHARAALYRGKKCCYGVNVIGDELTKGFSLNQGTKSPNFAKQPAIQSRTVEIRVAFASRIPGSIHHGVSCCPSQRDSLSPAGLEVRVAWRRSECKALRICLALPDQ